MAATEKRNNSIFIKSIVLAGMVMVIGVLLASEGYAAACNALYASAAIKDQYGELRFVVPYSGHLSDDWAEFRYLVCGRKCGFVVVRLERGIGNKWGGMVIS
jgi:hypothetical protein